MIEEDYSKRLQQLTNRVNQIHKNNEKQPSLYSNTYQVSNTTYKELNTYKQPNTITDFLKKNIKYSYFLILLTAIVLYFIKPSFIMIKTKDKNNKFTYKYNTGKFIIILLITTGLIYGINTLINKKL